MAEDMHLSVSQFSARFRRFSTLSPQRFLITWRVRHACRLLAETDQPLKVIAASLGYRDVFFFSRQFHQVTGQTPSTFRQAHAEPQE
jgi:AraC-like DNA-binding protein